MRNLPTKNLTLIAVLLASLSAEVAAQTPQEKGLAIATEADRRDKGWGDQESEMVMALRNKLGKESSRKIRTRAMEVTGDGDKSLNIFDEPADVKGTAFLSYTHSTSPDDQWLYLPALKRVKRISSSNKSGPFMGSEFAYEDIASQEIDKYEHTWLRDETVGDQDCYVIEQVPTYKKSGYTRRLAWIDKEHYRVIQTEFYDRKNVLLKTLNFKDYKQYLDTFWRAHQLSMVNHQTGKSTVLSWSNYTFQNGFTDRDFDKSGLQRVR